MIDAALLRPRRRIFWTLLGGYASYYLCRANLSIAQPEIAKAFEWDEPTVGTIASFYYLVYAIGKLVSGVIADRLGGRALFAVGAFGSAAANLCFPLASSLTGMTIVWSINAFFQSMGWAALVSIMSRWYGQREQATAMGLISTSYQLGDAAARAFMSLLVLALPWHALFSVPALGFAVMGAFAAWILRNSPKDIGAPSPHEDEHADVASPDDGHARAFAREVLRRTLFSPYLWAMCAISALLTFIRYTFLNWAPTYLAAQGSGAAASAVQSALFPLMGAAGSVLAGWYSDRYSGSRRAPIMVLLCAVLAVTLAAFGWLGELSTAANVALLGVAGFALYGPYSLLGGAIAIDLGSRHAAATAAGIIDGVGYAAAIASGAGMGFLIKHLGWSASFLALAGAALACVAIALVLWRVQAVPPGSRRP
jgi:sugar phosphate permease